MQTLNDLAVGDRVVLRDVNERRLHGDDPPKAIVVKIGRTLVHVVQLSQLGRYRADIEKGDTKGADWYVHKYRIDGGHATGAYGNHSWIRTLEQHEDDMLRKSLLDHLRGAGVTLTGIRSDLTTQQLAAILAIVRPDDDGGDES